MLPQPQQHHEASWYIYLHVFICSLDTCKYGCITCTKLHVHVLFLHLYRPLPLKSHKLAIFDKINVSADRNATMRHSKHEKNDNSMPSYTKMIYFPSFQCYYQYCCTIGGLF